MTDDTFTIERQFKYVRYSEGDRSLEFDREPSATGEPTLVWFPSPKLWRETMPVWAHARRRQILSRVRAAVPEDECRVSYAHVDSVRDDDLDLDPS